MSDIGHAPQDSNFTSTEIAKTTIANCIYGNTMSSEYTALTDGEFEGLKPGMRRLTTHAHKFGNIQCDYEYITDSVDARQQPLED